MNFRTKPRGIHANFQSECHLCGGEITVSNGRIDNHRCERPVTLEQIRDALQTR